MDIGDITEVWCHGALTCIISNAKHQNVNCISQLFIIGTIQKTLLVGVKAFWFCWRNLVDPHPKIGRIWVSPIQELAKSPHFLHINLCFKALLHVRWPYLSYFSSFDNDNIYQNLGAPSEEWQNMGVPSDSVSDSGSDYGKIRAPPPTKAST